MKKFNTTDEIKIPEKLVDQVIGQEKAVNIIKKAARQHRNVMLIGEPGCLISDERIFLGNGAIAKIGELGNGHLEPINVKLIIGSGNKTDTATVFHAYKNQPLIEIITESGKSIKGTYNHPILTAERSWKRLDEIKVGDRVAVVSGIRCTITEYIKSGFKPIKRNGNGPKFWGRLPEKITPELGALFGYIIGDGWVNKNRERIGLVVSDDEKEILPVLASIITSNFGVEPRIYRRKPRHGRSMPLDYLEINNKDVYHNLKFLGEKRVPNLILMSGNEVASEFIKWLFTADGTVYDGGRGRRGINLKSVNLELLRDVQMMLLRFGIHSRILGIKAQGINNAPQLAIRRGYDIIKFKEKIGFACKKKIKALETLAKDAERFARVKKQRSERVVDVIIGDRADVFDVEVPVSHRFIANGIVTHNTGKTLLAQAIAELLPVTELEDVLVYRNVNDENHPIIKNVKTYDKVEPGKPLGDGQGRQIVQKEKIRSRINISGGKGSIVTPIITLLVIGLVIISLTGLIAGYELVLFGALILGILIFGSVIIFVTSFRRAGILPGAFDTNEPKLIVDNTGMTHAPFYDGTGARAGHLFGDVKHDPLQCIPKGEMVLAPNGNPINIEKLVDSYFPGDSEGEINIPGSAGLKVLGGYDSEFRLSAAAVRRLYRRRYNGDIIRIKTRSGSVIRMTPNHPIAFIDGFGSVDYIEAGGISKDTRIVIPSRIKNTAAKEMDDSMLIFIADLLADGYMGQRHIEFNLKRDFKIREITNDIKRLGYIPKIKIRPDGATCIQVNSVELCRTLFDMGIKEGKVKRIPDLVFGQEKQKIALFLSRFIAIDGYVNKSGQFEILNPKGMIEQIRSLLFILGINAKYRTRIDRGYGKEKRTIQHILRWNHFVWAQEYYSHTINPIHIDNLKVYLGATTFNKECYNDIVSVGFGTLDRIRTSFGMSKEAVHRDYWSINPSVRNHTNLTRSLLNKINDRFVEVGGLDDDTLRLKKLGEGDYASDEIVDIGIEKYDGFVYNMTTETGNYMVNFVLTHNSGGLGTPAHLRVEGGLIHKANKGVLFIDEVADIEAKSQQELLTAMQEKKYAITGQSEMSSGALVRTEPVPCDFLLVAAGNLQDIPKMHPALRSRIRGYGYEVYMDSTMPDTEQNREKIIRFIAQEVKKDGKIPPFGYEACMEILEEARRRSGRKGKLTLILRELGGAIRAAGDMAMEKERKIVTREDVIGALRITSPIEAQFVEQSLEYRKDYKIFKTSGYAIGRVNGLAIVGSSYLSAGIVLPIVAEVTKSSSKTEGKLIPTGKLGKIAKEAVKNISAVIKRHMNRDMASYDIHVQFLQTYEGVEGDSASISVAVAVISALEGIPVSQEVAMTGSLSVRGDVLPVGGITNKVRAAIEAGVTYVIIPESNAKDIYIDSKELKKVKVIPVRNIAEVLHYALKKSARRDQMVGKLRKYITNDSRERAPLVLEEADDK
ncbi:MAG: ATP-dependent protease LonB [Candidatus Micrarchaeaceae archaeon]